MKTKGEKSKKLLYITSTRLTYNYRGHHHPPSFDCKEKLDLDSLHLTPGLKTEIMSYREVAMSLIPLESYL
jgi:hypothetical protein